ncbi:aminotransferase class I/II-fold pyridoxal phosphate-dependent enzyme [Jatrophihabitans sp. YIM 134969]
MRVFAAAEARRADGLPVYDLSAGQPSTPAPLPAREAAALALGADRLGYTGALGLPALREAIAMRYGQVYGVEVTPEAVAVTTGSSGGLTVAFLAAFDADDSVVLTRPGYPAYRNVLLALGCEVVEVPLRPDARLTVADLEALPEPPAGLVVASPANPTGTMVTPDSLAEIVRWCDAHDVRLVSDEIYHGIGYGPRASTAWETSRTPIVMNSFSKYFSMTGWRIGWLLLPDELRGPVDTLAANATICPPALSQYAALGALSPAAVPELEANVARYAENRAMLLERLPAIGLDRLAPADGAFYVYADVSRWTSDSLTWAGSLLDATGVAVAPGVDFDLVDGGRWIRMCFAGDGGVLAEAVDVLGRYLA